MSQKLHPTFFRLRRIVLVGATLLGLHAASQPAFAVKPGASSEVTSSRFGTRIAFRYCPAGKIRPGKPVAGAAKENLPEPLDVRDFYLGQTEITMGQLRAVIGDAGMTPLKRHAAALSGTPEILQKVQNGKDEPALLVTLDVAVDFCVKLQASFDEERAQQKQATIETRIFRLPSHVEWQYAARALPNADDQSQRPHFARWADYDNLSKPAQQKCGELWRSLGRQGLFPGDQDSFLVISNVSTDQQSKLREVLTEAFQVAFKSKPRNASGVGSLQPVGSTTPNEWNISDLHEGVSEWAIWSMNGDRTRSLWNEMLSKHKAQQTLEGQESIYLCGGSFLQAFDIRGGLSRFTVWGGPKLIDDVPQPLTYRESEIVQDIAPGFRVVMERSLADDWLFVLRRGVFEQGQIVPMATDYVSSNRLLMNELVPATDAKKSVLEFYSDLIASTPRNRAKLRQQLKQVSSLTGLTPTGNGATPSSGASRLTSLVGGLKKKAEDVPTTTSSPATTTNDEADFFNALSSVMESATAATSQ